MTLPRDLTQMPAKHGKEAEDLNAEEREAEDMGGACEPGRKHG